MKVSYPVKVAVKKTAFIALFSGMVLSAGAQNTNLITEEEPDIKVTKDTVWNMAIEKKATPKVQFPNRETQLMYWILSCTVYAIPPPMIGSPGNPSR